MNFIIQEEITLDITNPIGFASNIPNNLFALITKNYCGNFINNRYYVEVKEILGYTDIFIQINNSGNGSITCVVKFLCIVYSPNTLVFNLKLQGSDIRKNVIVGKYSSSQYPKLDFVIPLTKEPEKVIKVANIVTFAINKMSTNLVQADFIETIYPIILPFDLTEELSSSTSNKAFVDLLNKDKEFDKIFYEVATPKAGPFFVYEKGVIYESEMLPRFYQNLTNISDRELCLDTLEKIIYNFIQYY